MNIPGTAHGRNHPDACHVCQRSVTQTAASLPAHEHPRTHAEAPASAPVLLHSCPRPAQYTTVNRGTHTKQALNTHTSPRFTPTTHRAHNSHGGVHLREHSTRQPRPAGREATRCVFKRPTSGSAPLEQHFSATSTHPDVVSAARVMENPGDSPESLPLLWSV